jgi:regulator of protease activity HflC (stomatin/prohibitin superfamily)
MKGRIGAIAVVIVVIVVLIILFSSLKSIPAGHVGVATLFGKVQAEPYEEGLHVVNPLYAWYLFDVRQKTHKERAMVPSQDQLTTSVDISVQFRLKRAMAAKILQETGQIEQVIVVHLVPKLRSLVREQGKSIKRAEDFFLEETQNKLEAAMLLALREYMDPMGVEVQAVLIRDLQLPAFITRAIESKKEREQAAEKQKAELERFKTEQEQKIATAAAERKAAEEEAKKKRVLADAQAYEIEKINKAIAGSPAYIQLKALEALQAISKDPAAKLYFIDSKGSHPLPLMHLGDVPAKKQ